MNFGICIFWIRKNIKQIVNRFLAISYTTHFPYFGMGGVDDAENLRNAWELSCEMYQQRFGKINNELWVGSARWPNCGKRCRNDIAYGYMNEQRPRLSEMH